MERFRNMEHEATEMSKSRVYTQVAILEQENIVALSVLCIKAVVSSSLAISSGGLI